MAGRFPLARNVDEFWRNLRDGVESIRRLSDAELLTAGVSREVLARAEYVKAAAVLEDVGMFDASFFGFSPKDAAIMDPQHRHFLECAWEAVENAGHPPENFSGSIGVFAGSGMNSYLMHNLINNRRLMDSAGLFLIRQTGNDKDVLATRVSYQLDLRGPSLSVQTACSSSLVAVHLACQSLLGCECDMALAGGVTIEIPHSQGYVYREGEILSRDGHCRAFDSASSGTVFSSGVGIVVLRRLEDAIADGDTIHAVILGSAVNNDGQRKVGYLAPSVAGQAEAIAEALGVAGVRADSISYVETHGTGTAVGDPLEIKGLTQAFRAGTARTGYCAIGSLKTNVGHLDAAAGVAGLIKTVLALEHRQIPASLHFKEPNPRIDFQNSPFFVNTSLAEWRNGETPRRAGVTSLGIGGTNAHVVLEEAPAQTPQSSSRSCHLIPLSAKTETALEPMAARLAAHLGDNPGLRLADVAFTAQVGRKAFPHRRIVVAGDTTEAARLLSAHERRPGFSGSAASSPKSITFLFSGQGAQYEKMGAELYQSEPIFRDSFDRCAVELREHLGLDLREIVFPDEANAAWAAGQLSRTSITQPALCAFEYSLAQWWMRLGVRPQAMLGHSIGEYVAACLAGVFSLEDALAITSVRGRLMEACAPGAMLAVALSAAEMSEFEDLSIAAINAPRQCVFSGPVDSIAKLERRFTAEGVICHRLPTSHAFHSPMMEPMLDSFLARMREVSLAAPRIPYLSNLTGRWIKDSEATDPGYWGQHVLKTVRFSDCVTELLREPGRLMIEIGPGRTLASLVRQQMGETAVSKGATVYHSIPRSEERVADTAVLLTALGQVWLAGHAVDWSALHIGESVKRIPLPTYPFERKRYWIEPDNLAVTGDAMANSGSLEHADAKPSNESNHEEREPTSPDVIDQWFYERAWRRTEQPKAASRVKTSCLVFHDSTGFGDRIIRNLRNGTQQVIEITPGDAFKRTAGGHFSIRPGTRDDYGAVLDDLASRSITPKKIVHLWSVENRSSHGSTEHKLERGFYSLMFLAQALGDASFSDVDIAIVSNRLHSVLGESVSDPVAATLLGPVRVIPKELSGIRCCNIDVDIVGDGAALSALYVELEQSGPVRDQVVAWRRGTRWTQALDRISLRDRPGPGGLKHRGVYLITGGLGGLGLAIALDLARLCQARLILLGRTPLPPSAEWQAAALAASTPEHIKDVLCKLLDIVASGAEVDYLSCDVTRRDEMQRALSSAVAKHETINGVIHAAGVVEDRPIQLKSPESAARVLGPKVRGTLVLNEVLNDVLKGAKLDFFSLFSSVSSLKPPPGQIDYAAANAFLDAFAVSQADRRVVAVNWGPWRRVGIAARTSHAHPLLGRSLVQTPEHIAFTAPLDAERNWVLADHRLTGGLSVFPGTGYLEMARAAITRDALDCRVECKDVFFHTPLFYAAGQSRESRIDLHRATNGTFNFSVRSREDEWVEHASGQISRFHGLPPGVEAIDQIHARCRSRVLSFDDAHRTEQEKFFEFGPRWRCLKKLHLGDDESLAELELTSALSDDRADYHLHPALLDLATGSAIYLLDNYGKSDELYFPMFYKRLVAFRPIPMKCWSHIRSLRNNFGERDVATFDITLRDEHGRVLVDIEGFSMRRIREAHRGLGIASGNAAAKQLRSGTGVQITMPGIAPEQGVRAFRHLVMSDAPKGLVVVPESLTFDTYSPPASTESSPGAPGRDATIESVLANWWRELLGLQEVGLDEDFFELGGHSLVVVRLFAKIKNEYAANLDLSKLFEARTIRKLAELVRSASTSRALGRQDRSLVAIQPKGKRSPLFVMAGLGGHVIGYHRLAQLLGEDQPVFGVLPRGLDGNEALQTQVGEIAEHCVEVIRAAQPQGAFRLVGHSFGGIVAFEVAQQLIAQGAEVSLLGLFDTIEPQYWKSVWKSLGFRARVELICSEFLDSWREGDTWRPLRSRVRSKLARIPFIKSSPALPHVADNLPKSLSQVNRQAAENYQPRPYPGAIHLFRATSRDAWEGDDEYLGWGQYVRAGIEVHHVASTHANILGERTATILAAKLNACLDCDGGSRSSASNFARSIQTV
jgi:acyl transferase domain-containing protein